VSTFICNKLIKLSGQTGKDITDAEWYK
jgi:hypothetical protein